MTANTTPAPRAEQARKEYAALALILTGLSAADQVTIGGILAKLDAEHFELTGERLA